MAIWYPAFHSQNAAPLIGDGVVPGQIYLLLAILERREKRARDSDRVGTVGLADLYTYALCALTVGALALFYLWLGGPLHNWKRTRRRASLQGKGLSQQSSGRWHSRGRAVARSPRGYCAAFSSVGAHVARAHGGP